MGLTGAQGPAGPQGPAGDTSALASTVSALQTQVNNNMILLNQYVTVDTASEIGVAGPNVVFHGVNVHIVSGSGATDDNVSTGGTLTGLGNLIIGYDETDPRLPEGRPPNHPGSHNLVVGISHAWGSYGGLLAGAENTITQAFGFCAGFANGVLVSGANPTAMYGSVVGGEGNLVTAKLATVLGGEDNQDNAASSSIVGGLGNITDPALAFPADSTYCAIVGGEGNHVNGEFNVVLAGYQNNQPQGSLSVILGGQNLTETTNYSIYPHTLP